MSEEGRLQEEEASRGIMGSYPEVRTKADRPISAGFPSFSSRLGGSPLCREAGALLCCLLSSLLWAQQSGRETLTCLGPQVCSSQNYKGQKHKSQLLRSGCKGAGSNRSCDLYFDNLSEIN